MAPGPRRFILAVLIAGLAAASYVAGRWHAKRADGQGGAARAPAAAVSDRTVQAERAYARLAEYYSARLDEQRASAPSWAEVTEADDPAEWSAWQARARAHMLDILQPWPGPRIEGVSEREPWFQRDGVTAWQVRIPTHEGIEMPAALLIPDGAEAPLPAILTLHGSDGTLQALVEDVDYHHGFAMALARNGFLVLAPYRPTGLTAKRQALRSLAHATGNHLEALELWQVSRAIDYLTTLDEVDRDHIGVYGISSGGTLAMRIGAIDTRVSLTLVSGKFMDRDQVPRATRLEADALDADMAMLGGALPGMAFFLDDANLAALVIPRYFGVENGQDNRLFEPARSKFGSVADLYRRAGHEDRARFLPFPGRHETSVATVLPFLRQWASDDSG